MNNNLAELLNDMRIELGNKKLEECLKEVLSINYGDVFQKLNKIFDCYYDNIKQDMR